MKGPKRGLHESSNSPSKYTVYLLKFLKLPTVWLSVKFYMGENKIWNKINILIKNAINYNVCRQADLSVPLRLNLLRYFMAL